MALAGTSQGAATHELCTQLSSSSRQSSGQAEEKAEERCWWFFWLLLRTGGGSTSDCVAHALLTWKRNTGGPAARCCG